MICKKVSFINEKFALEYIDKLQRTSTRSRKPVNAYLCHHCLSWHLTSIELKEIKQLKFLNRQVENLKSKVLHLQKENSRLILKLKN